MISDEAVEAAAKASFAHWQPHKVWGENQRIVDIFMEDTRIILEAAASHQAELLREAQEEAWNQGWAATVEAEMSGRPVRLNPYRS